MARPTDIDKLRSFAELHRSGELFVLANPTTVGTARTLEELGYSALGTSSAALARSMGREDGRRQITRDQAIAHAMEINAAVDIPVSGDFENGYGDDPDDVALTVRDAMAAGLAGCSVEDATGLAYHPIYSPVVAQERIRAGAQIASGSDFVLVARAENYLHERPDLADTIARLQSFQEAGADALYAPGLESLREIETIVASVDVPLNVLIGLPGQDWTLGDLAEVGVGRVSVGSGFERIANRALHRAAKALIEDRAWPSSG